MFTVYVDTSSSGQAGTVVIALGAASTTTGTTTAGTGANIARSYKIKVTYYSCSSANR